MDSKKLLAFAACVIGAVLLVFALRSTNKLPPSSFKAFYCAGETVLDRKDPYTIEPLRACEHRLAPAALPPYAVEPAPLPGYALVPWSAGALLSPDAARQVYYLILVAALAITALALAQLAPLSPATTMLALSASWLLNLSYGELPPIATACVALTALMLARGRPWLAALCAAGVALEPHIAVPMWLAIVLFVRPMRLPLAVVAGALLLTDVAIGGPHAAVAYFSGTLPAQALSEVFATDQLSFTHAAVVAGLNVQAALRIGAISYIVMAIAGIAVARRLSARNGPEFLALVPPAFVLLGGTFVHDIQFYTALPLALVLLARSARPNPIGVVAAVLLAVPWSEATSRLVLLLSATSVFTIAWIALPPRPSRILACACAAFAAVALVLAINRLPSPPHRSSPKPPPAAAALRADDQAARDWAIYLSSDPALSQASPRSTARIVPKWSGALLLIVWTIGFGGWARKRPAEAPA